MPKSRKHPKKQQRRGERVLDRVGLSDRLNDIASELTIIGAAIDGLGVVQDPEAYGFFLTLRRHMDEIRAIGEEITPSTE